MEGNFPHPPPPSSFRNWEKHGISRSRTIDSISEEPGNSGTGSSSRPRTRGMTNSSSGRQTQRWPFHSVSNSRSSIRYQSSLPHSRNNSFTRRAAGSIAHTVSTVLGSDVIPDYVVHFLRGETPESLAQKRGVTLPGTPDTANFPGHTCNCDSPANSHFFDHPRADTPRAEMEKMLRDQREPNVARRLTAGWRGGVTLNVCLAFLLFVASVLCLGYAGARGKISTGGSTIVGGKSKDIQAADWGVHAMVNVFAFILIAGANYVIQILSSPTRAEVDAAHASFKWLEIGIPSLRNFGLISRARGFLSVAFVVFALTSQLIYNSLIFTTQTASAINIAFVSTPYVNSDSTSAIADLRGMSQSALSSLQSKAKSNSLTRLTTEECISTFDNAFQTDYSGVLLISKSDSNSVETTKSATLISAFLQNINERSDSINYCLAEKADDPEYSLTLSGPLLGVMGFLNLLFVLALAIVMALAISRRDFNPLVTLGDALASFLEDPDPTTQDACMLSKSAVKKGSWGQREAKIWAPGSVRWYTTPSVLRWAIWLLSFLTPLGLGAAALAMSVMSGVKNPFSSFGEATVVYQLPNGPRVGLAIIAALPQVLLGVLYLSTNTLLTLFYLSNELSMFVSPGRLVPLRISSGRPIGAQTTSLYLTLPRPLSWILFFLVAGMAFLLSQGVILVAIDRNDGTSYSGIGFSPLPLLLLLVVLVVLGLFTIGLSFRQADRRGGLDDGAPAGNPLTLPGGSCSAVLSSKCHRLPQEDGVEALAVRWGVVRDGAPGHATFSSRPVLEVQAGHLYA